jgi:para-aminobenzoate synthetase
MSERSFSLPFGDVEAELGDGDVSLSYDAARREVTRHSGDRDEVVGDDVFAVLEQEVARDAGDPGVLWAGWFGYAARPDLPARPWGEGPDAVWMRTRSARPATGRLPEPAPRRSVGQSTAPPEWYAEAFDRVQEELHAGNTYEVNLTLREAVGRDLDPRETWSRLRAANPAPYAGFVSHRGTHVVSTSPERYARVDADGWIETRPIKGTTPRGATAEDDERLRRQLAEGAKYRAENLMIVDLLRNDLSVVCEVGTVTVPDLMRVESYASVHQLVSTVRGHLREDVSTVGALRAMFPAGSMTGAPKLRTMQVVDTVEESPRGPNAGALGWVRADGTADLGVVIRSLHAGPGGRWSLGTGGGITVRSDVGEEWDETRWKVERLRAALGAALGAGLRTTGR